jgi:hypothetical protein
MFGDPQTLNLYGYVRNNPLSKADVDGHCYPWCTVIGGAIVGGLIGGGGEIIAAKLHGQSVDWKKVEGSALKGAATGAAKQLLPRHYLRLRAQLSSRHLPQGLQSRSPELV